MLPSVITDADLGERTFYEDWSNFSASEMPTKPANPDRWRTVYGHGGPTKREYRGMSAGSIAVDPSFTGVENGACCSAGPLGLNTLVINPGNYAALQVKKTPPLLKGKCFDAPYIGAQINTKFSFAQLFGYFEVTAKVPRGKGLWPAFWLMPVSGQWPANGEIDVFEFVSGDGLKMHATLHNPNLPNRQSGTEITLPFDASSGSAHRFAVGWDADEIVWYVDRKEVKRLATPPDMKSVPMYPILNIACGGSWPGYPDDANPFPNGTPAMFVNRVSVWQFPS